LAAFECIAYVSLHDVFIAAKKKAAEPTPRRPILLAMLSAY
jgi:hypothetical protein